MPLTKAGLCWRNKFLEILTQIWIANINVCSKNPPCHQYSIRVQQKRGQFLLRNTLFYFIIVIVIPVDFDFVILGVIIEIWPNDHGSIVEIQSG